MPNFPDLRRMERLRYVMTMKVAVVNGSRRSMSRESFMKRIVLVLGIVASMALAGPALATTPSTDGYSGVAGVVGSGGGSGNSAPVGSNSVSAATPSNAPAPSPASNDVAASPSGNGT